MRTLPAAALALALTACGGMTGEPPGGSGGSVGSGGALGSGGSIGSGGSGNACTPGETSGGECTSCSCTEDGSWVCTDVYCPPGCVEGDTMDAGDGCNTCSCQNGAWACTLIDCNPSCQDGDVMSAGDGCNTCSCQNGAWLCTERACAEPECPVPDDLPEQDCTGNELYGRYTKTDACCALCYSLEDYTYYESMEACEASKVCDPGETKYADDFCNTCTCTADGAWACTDTACEAVWCGGFAGYPCAEDEYCAYEADTGGCGFADQSALCRKRPTACDAYEAPVCGCDGETYSNSCVAAMAGWGVMMDAPCEAPPLN